MLAGEHGGARITREEVFGPVVTVASIENEEDGIRRANSSPYGLGASVWTRDRKRARRVADRLHAGSVWTNDHAYSYGLAQAPYLGTLLADRLAGDDPHDDLRAVWRARPRFAPAPLFSGPALRAGWAIDRISDRLARRS